jgi:hypothetical protein
MGRGRSFETQYWSILEREGLNSDVRVCGCLFESKYTLIQRVFFFNWPCQDVVFIDPFFLRISPNPTRIEVPSGLILQCSHSKPQEVFHRDFFTQSPVLFDPLFKLGEGTFNWVEIWGIWRQKCKNDACVGTDLPQFLPLDITNLGEYRVLVNPCIIKNKD